MASFYIARAWHERGHNYAGSVSPQAWQGFRSNLDRAKAELERSAAISKACPHWYDLMQEVALGQGWQESEYEALFEEAVSKEPTYYSYYFAKANFYQPRWYGSHDKLKSFVDAAVARSYETEGYTLYARIYWSVSQYHGNDIFASGLAEWSKMKAGFEFMNRQYPNSNWNMNAYAHFACMAGDEEATGRAQRAIGDAIADGAWSSSEEVERCRKWAAPDSSAQPASSAERRNGGTA